jgi:RNA methyltransferase, TrmH family
MGGVNETARITSRSNPLIKLAGSLRERKERNRSGLFVVEGILHVGEAAEAGWAIDAILYAPDRLESEFAHRLIAEQSARGVRCESVSAPVFESISEKEHPQGILAIVRQQAWALTALSTRGLRFAAAVVAPQDPGNVGTILRTIDAVGADALILVDGGADPFHPSAVRAGMGTLFWKPVAQAPFGEFAAWVREHGYRLIGSSAHGSADYRSLAPDDRPLILLLGSEQKGLSPEQSAACEQVVSLPMSGRASSLNLAVAAGILLYALKP